MPPDKGIPSISWESSLAIGNPSRTSVDELSGRPSTSSFARGRPSIPDSLASGNPGSSFGYKEMAMASLFSVKISCIILRNGAQANANDTGEKDLTLSDKPTKTFCRLIKKPGG